MADSPLVSHDTPLCQCEIRKPDSPGGGGGGLEGLRKFSFEIVREKPSHNKKTAHFKLQKKLQLTNLLSSSKLEVVCLLADFIQTTLSAKNLCLI